MSIEIWKDIEDFEGLYRVSTLGRVMSLKRVGVKQKIKVPVKRDSGYLMLKLYKNGVPHWRFVHRLVAKAFIKNTNNKPCINHKDGNKENNRVSNLEWCTYAENNEHSYKHGLRKTRKVIQFENGKPIHIYRNCHVASLKTGIDYNLIWWCLHGRLASAGGYDWKYYQ